MDTIQFICFCNASHYYKTQPRQMNGHQLPGDFMKTVLTALALTLATLASTAQAKDIETSEMLSALIANASHVVMVKDDGKRSEQSLADLLGQALAVDTLAKVGSATTINSVTSGCEVTDVGRGGVGYYECGIQINNGDYTVTEKGFEGPILESSTMLRFKGIKNISGTGKFQLDDKKVTVSHAG
jgi:hypothetical protein